MCHPQTIQYQTIECASPSLHFVNPKIMFASTPVSKRVVQPPEQFAIYKRAKEELRRDTHNQLLMEQASGQSYKNVCRKLVFDNMDDDDVTITSPSNFQIHTPKLFGQP
ncbi:predicted protein [Naegleria gruberi]|uniref:Predicted protein n=1 Tax=Naegleria gruberi TaxID=5762 RepID=D2VCZ6_NAEGR|nr:uncharacterized protein NAEGRDRAFT_79477 [Naegleria gruberi]EFC45392.1 predicted protein [Naegleria gruberi]|eukprot:XP_002678136.1 predicted protein [Naegleria gruberi strain NEG-M]